MEFLDAQSALGFVTPQFYNIETTIYQIKYPSFDYSALIPVVTEGDPWGRGTLFRSADAAGTASFLSGKGFDIPYADVTRDQFLKGFELGGIGYEWSLEEINVARMEGRNLSDEKAQAARRISEQFLWNVAMTGNIEKNWTGLLNDAGVTATTATADGTGSSALWSTKTPDQILRDINAAITGIFTGSNEVEMADTVILPTARILSISTLARSANSDTTILSYLRQNNSYTAETGQPLTIRGSRALNTAGASGTARMVAYRKDPQVLRFHLPMPHQFLPPYPKSSMTYEVAGIFRTGGVEIRLPKAVSYVDGI